MAIQIRNYNFDGPHIDISALRAQSGVYVILGSSGGNTWTIVDIGESQSVRDRIENHDRKPEWRQQGHRQLAAAAFYVPERQRMLIERELRTHYDPPCGER